MSNRLLSTTALVVTLVGLSNPSIAFETGEQDWSKRSSSVHGFIHAEENWTTSSQAGIEISAVAKEIVAKTSKSSVQTAPVDKLITESENGKKTSSNRFNESESSAPTHRILSLDGGGIRGIGTLVLLAELEARTGKTVQDMYDAFVGTSTGGIIATCFANGYTANKLLGLYYDHGDSIFDISYSHSFKTLAGLIGPRYEAPKVTALSEKFLGKNKVSNTQKPFAVTTNSTTSGFKLLESHADANTINPEMADQKLSKLIRATSAAPTYFKGTKLGDSICVDGGVAANDPSLHAYAYGQKLFGRNANIKVDSFGTGELSSDLKKAAALSQHAGKLNAVTKLAGLFMGGATTSDQAVLKNMLGDKYKRFQFNTPEDIDLADVSKKGDLMKYAHLATQSDAFKMLIDEHRGFTNKDIHKNDSKRF